MRVACVIVHYHTPELACRAVESVREDAAASGLEADVVVVDNGSDEEGRRRLDGIDASVVRPGRNLGYAGGVNLGVARTAAEYAVLMNADVELIPGCLAGLVETLHAGAAAAAPRLYLDRERRFLLPPKEVRTRGAEILRRLASRGDPWARWARSSWRRHARRHWLADRPFASVWLSGALLAIRRDAWDAAGPFDEEYRLYFEEVDWLLRLRRRGLTSMYVPEAESLHWYNRSAAGEPRAAEWFDASARRFAERHYGAAFLAFAARLGSGRAVAAGEPTPPSEGVPSIPLPGPERAVRPPLWVELSASPLRFPAAAGLVTDRTSRHWSFEPSLWNELAPGRYSLTLVDTRGFEWGAFGFARAETRR
jgi:N-acetylglucosaminyl-diphospho-decaprenol L-rhamnosyltransferase